MKKFNTYTNLYRLIAAAAIVIIMISIMLEGSFSAPLLSYAATEDYSDVLTDLQSDDDFNVSDYPVNNKDYSLYAIQIAESEDGELFIYVYQPYTGNGYDLTATSINISKTVGSGNLNYRNYSLTLLSKAGTLCKYLVNGFELSGSALRYYDISAIYRAYYTAIDGTDTSGGTTNELAISVAQQWQATTYNGEVYYYMENSTVIELEVYAGYVRYFQGSPINFSSLSAQLTGGNTYTGTDRHFVAIKCTDNDFNLDEVYEADISFDLQGYKTSITASVAWDFTVSTETETVTVGDLDTTYSENPLKVSSDDEAVEVSSVGLMNLFNKQSYSWDTIMTAEEFVESIKGEDNASFVDENALGSISNYDYVFNFYETDWTLTCYSSVLLNYSYTHVTGTTVLRLKFRSEGEVYDIGVVADKVTESDNPIAVIGGFDPDSFYDWLKIIAMVIGLILLCVLLAPLLPYIAQFIVWVVLLPFKLIRAVANAVSKALNNRKNE